MYSVLILSSELVLLGICSIAVRRALMSLSSNWIYYTLTAVLALYAAATVVLFIHDLPHLVPPALAGGSVLFWLIIRRLCERRRAADDTWHHSVN